MSRLPRKFLIVAASAMVLLVATGYALLRTGGIDLSDSRWIFSAVRRSLEPQPADLLVSAAYRALPGDSRYEIVYALRQGLADTREYYRTRLAGLTDSGDAAELRLSGRCGGRVCTVRNYYSEVSNLYCLTLSVDVAEAKAAEEAMSALPGAKLLAPGGACSELAGLESYGGFVLYNLDPLDKAMQLDRPVLSRAWRWTDDIDKGRAIWSSLAARLGGAPGNGVLAGVVDGHKVEVAKLRTDLGVDLITVRIQ